MKTDGTTTRHKTRQGAHQAALSMLGMVTLVCGLVVPAAQAAAPPSPPPGPMISIGDAVATESSCGVVNAVFTVQLSRTSPMVVSVNYETANGSAISGADYQAQSGTLTFAPKERTKVIQVPILSDQITEGPETFVVNLKSAFNGTIGESQAVGTIFNDPCDDADACTADSCDASTAALTCRHTAVSCDDHNICTTDTCSAGTCQHQADNLGQTTCGVGACQRTVPICLNGVPQTCTPGTPTAEICNGVDDDCNGVVDGPGAESSCHLANAAAQCVGGTCAIGSCNAGFGDCDASPTDGCEQSLNDVNHCGTCATTCGTPPNGTAACTAGSCQFSCNAGFTRCDNQCLNLSSDASNCGACGNACGAAPNGTSACVAGSCTVQTCATGFGDCDGNGANGCESPLNTLTNCGACATACARDNASASCFTGSCTIGSCNAGFDDCDGNAANGCEAPLDTLSNCGSCGRSCDDANACTDDSCPGGSCQHAATNVVCSPGDECHDPGTCDPATGLCSNPAKADNTACSGGACCAGSCVSLNLAQSTSNIDVYSLSLKPGYQPVGVITNCGACGNDCGGTTPCTTKLCVPSGNGLGACRQYNRAQCSEARSCDGALGGGGPVPLEPECAGLDDDHDGLSVEWETPQTNPYSLATQAAGIDLNCNGEISSADEDLVWHEPPAGDHRPDIYLEIDTMGDVDGSGRLNDPILGVFPEPPFYHQPPVNPTNGKSAVVEVKEAFARADVTLHVDPVVQEVPHHQLIYLSGPSDNVLCGNSVDPATAEPSVSFNSLKDSHFDPRRRIGYHYVISAHNSCSALTEASAASPSTDGTGTAEIGGNDMIVSLAGHAYYQPRFCADSNGDGVSDSISCCLPTDCCLGDESHWDSSCGTVLPARPNPYSCEGSAGFELCVTQSDRISRFREWAGTLMHELGHNLGLCHGGIADFSSEDPCANAMDLAPNHISSMNHFFQLGGILHTPQNTVDPNTGALRFDVLPSRRVDFSHGFEASLNEMSLDESQGLGVSTWPWYLDFSKYWCGGQIVTITPPLPSVTHSVPVDWNCNQILEGPCDPSTGVGCVSMDVNGDGAFGSLPRIDEWSNLSFRFQCQPGFSD